MPLNKIIIKNYKSLKDFQLDLKPLMVFIGRNNVGKSNIFDCLRFLSDLIKAGFNMRNIVQERGGFEQIVFNGDISQTILIELQGSIEVKNEGRKYTYSVELKGDRLGNCLNKHEVFSLIISENYSPELFEFPNKEGRAVAYDEKGNRTGDLASGNDKLFLPSFSDEDHYPILGHFVNEIKNWAFFNFSPQLMRGSLPVQKELNLQAFGENLSAVLHVLQTEYPKKFQEIEEILKTALAELDELTTGLTSHAPGQTYARIREKGLKLSIPAWGMSDGTLRLLGHLATLFLPTLPPLACFEEPENYVHPRLLELIVDLLKNASEKSQIFVTTHSPYFVDLLQPEDLYIVDKQEGQTQVKKAEDKKGIKEALKTLGLGEMWFSGSLGGNP